MYEPCESNVFKAGELLLFYVEPKEYKLKTISNISKFGVTMDLELTSASGASLFYKDSFLDQNFIGRHSDQETMFNGNLDIDIARQARRQHSYS